MGLAGSSVKVRTSSSLVLLHELRAYVQHSITAHIYHFFLNYFTLLFLAYFITAIFNQRKVEYAFDWRAAIPGMNELREYLLSLVHLRATF